VTRKLVIICGLSFSGKSTLGKALAKRFEYAEVDVDETKFRLHGSRVKDTDLGQAQWDNIYSETDREIARYLKAGRNVVDASRNFRRVERDRSRAIALYLRADVVTIYVNTPESIARKRWLANRERPSRRDISDRDFEKIVAVMEPPTPDEGFVTFNYEDDVSDWISKFSRSN